jgi:hypothetical protein
VGRVLGAAPLHIMGVLIAGDEARRARSWRAVCCCFSLSVGAFVGTDAAGGAATGGRVTPAVTGTTGDGGITGEGGSEVAALPSTLSLFEMMIFDGPRPSADSILSAHERTSDAMSCIGEPFGAVRNSAMIDRMRASRAVRHVKTRATCSSDESAPKEIVTRSYSITRQRRGCAAGAVGGSRCPRLAAVCGHKTQKKSPQSPRSEEGVDP